MRTLFIAIIALAVIGAAFAQTLSTAAPEKPLATGKPEMVSRRATAKGDHPISSLPYTPSLDVAAMDKSANPCVDFYQYSCGGWIKDNPIPADQPRWSVYGKLSQDNQRFLWGILDDLANKTSGRNANQQKIGDYFAACMDEPAIEKLGAAPLKPLLNEIDQLKSKNELPGILARLHLEMASSGLFFDFGSNQDYADASQVIAFAVAGGLGLPDRDYYTKDDARSAELRQKYVAHVQRMLEFLGDKPKRAQQEAAKIMEIETALAKASLTRVEQRDPYQLFHKVNFQGLQELAPGFGWGAYIMALGLPPQDTFNVTEPAFYKEFEHQLQLNSLEDIKSYLRWHTVHAAAPLLSPAFVDENFSFFSKTLRGVPQLRPRWQRCVALVDRQLGEALGQEFVNRAFSPELKQKTLALTRQIEHAMEVDLDQLAWMCPATKQKALEKLHAVVNKIGYPDRWRDYSSVEINRNDFLGNALRANRFEAKRQLAKIGQALDRGEWMMPPPTVNAYYDPQMNDINFPAGVLQPPLYDPKMDDAPNYGDTGGTIGHELTHGFDDEGRQFDAKGNLRDWWTDQDAKNFDQRAQCIVDQYAQYPVVDDIKINSKLTEGEDIADLGGLILAWMAWKEQSQNQHLHAIAPEQGAPGIPQENRDGFTPDQRFFIGYAQWACENNRSENLRVSAITDPHSPGKYRVNGVVANMPEFEIAFACRAGQPMAPKQRCRVW
jgi:endothelin-converting enzyme/putative endopeptidase